MQKLIKFMSVFCLISSAYATSVPFTPYADITINTHWDSQYQDMEPADLAKVSQESGIKHYRLAFITDAGNCQPAWGAQSSYSTQSKWGAHLTDKLRANGVDYSVSFGGASGNDISKACSTTQLVSELNAILATYKPAGFDFDIENGSANVPKLMSALKQFQQSHPDMKLSFTLPVMPEGLTTEGKSVVEQAKSYNLNFNVNIMAMDYGPAYANDMGEYAIQAATNLFSYLKTLYPAQTDEWVWNRIEVTPMIGVNDVNVEQFTLANADNLHRFAQLNKLGALSMWSVSRDHACADKWASPVCSGNNLQSNSYDFARKFM